MCMNILYTNREEVSHIYDFILFFDYVTEGVKI